MRILLFSWRGPKHPHEGGAEIVTSEYAKAWIQKGHQVVWFTSAFEGGKDHEIIDGIEIIRRGSEILSVQLQAIKWYLLQNRHRFDLVIDQFHGLPFFTPLFVKTPKLAFIHEVTKNVWRYNPLSEPWHSIVAFLGQRGEPFIFKLFYKNVPFLTVSDSTRNELIEWGIPKKNITVIHNGVKKVAPLNIPKKKIITFFGAIAEDKGIEDALKVFVLLKDQNVRFWVIGKYDNLYFKKVKRLVKKLDLSAKIKFWGYVSERKKNQLLAQSLVIVNPSVREGWGLTVIESAQMGTPTVAYKVSGLQDAIVDQKTGLLAKSKTPEALSSLVRKLLSDKKLYQFLQKEDKKWAKQFDWNISTKKSLQLINFLTQ